MKNKYEFEFKIGGVTEESTKLDLFSLSEKASNLTQGVRGGYTEDWRVNLQYPNK